MLVDTLKEPAMAGVPKHGVYVTSLFSIFHALGVTQRLVAARLGVTPSHVSMWATGARPVPEVHYRPLLALVWDAIAAVPTPDPDFRDGSLLAHVLAMLEVWENEVQDSHVCLDVWAACRQIRDYAARPLDEFREVLHGPERAVLLRAFTRAANALKRLDVHVPRPEAAWLRAEVARRLYPLDPVTPPPAWDPDGAPPAPPAALIPFQSTGKPRLIL
jgi:transcriptional regulator with XRE-family HTH domain